MAVALCVVDAEYLGVISLTRFRFLTRFLRFYGVRDWVYK